MRENGRLLFFFGIALLIAALALGLGEREQAAANQAPATRTEARDQPREAASAGAGEVSDEDLVPERVPRPLVAPITQSMLETMRAIAARDPSRADDVFAKMGGSSVVNHGFLHCFDEDEVDLTGRESLAPTLAFFRQGRINTRSPFTRTSLAAAVGWSIRQAMGGRPSYVVQELRATRARFALAFFGSNDVMGKNAHQFAARLDRLASVIAEQGVVPVLGATYPRVPRDTAMNEQVRRYNRVSSALAASLGLPYIDFHQAMVSLPGRGLAADGYHPNTYTLGPRGRACDFSETGLRHGNNQRNLLVLTTLDALRRTLLEGEPAADDVPSHVGEGTREAPLRVRRLPFALRLPLERFAEAEAGSICEGMARSDARHVLRVRFEEATRVRISAVPMGELETHIEIVRPDGSCAGTGGSEEVLTLPEGTSEIAIVASRPRRPPPDATGEPRALVVLDVEP